MQNSFEEQSTIVIWCVLFNQVLSPVIGKQSIFHNSAIFSFESWTKCVKGQSDNDKHQEHKILFINNWGNWTPAAVVGVPTPNH